MWGDAREWVRVADSGQKARYHFCPNCGCTVWYVAGPFDDAVAVPVGLFRDPGFPPPRISVYEVRKHSWVRIEGEVDHHD